MALPSLYASHLHAELMQSAKSEGGYPDSDDDSGEHLLLLLSRWPLAVIDVSPLQTRKRTLKVAGNLSRKAPPERSHALPFLSSGSFTVVESVLDICCFHVSV